MAKPTTLRLIVEHEAAGVGTELCRKVALNGSFSGERAPQKKHQ
jgi:hypothetical protein